MAQSSSSPAGLVLMTDAGALAEPQGTETEAPAKQKGRKDKGKEKEMDVKQPPPAVVSDNDAEDEATVPDARLECIVDSALPSCPPLLTTDGRFILIAAPQLAIKVFSFDTAELVSTLYHPSAASSSSADAVRIVSILRHPSSESDVLVVTSDGSVVVFDYAEGEVVGRYDVGCIVVAATTAGLITPTPVQKDNGTQTTFAPLIRLVVASRQPVSTARSSARDTVYGLLLPTDSPSYGDVVRLENKTSLFHLPSLAALSASASGAWVGGVGGSQICIARLSDELGIGRTMQRPRVASFFAPEAICSITFPPDLDADGSTRRLTYFSIGAASGRIALWHALDPRTWDWVLQQQADKDNGRPMEPATCPTSILHWHAHAVSDLAFTSNGAYLVSAGDEGVVVLWQLEGADGNAAKEFLPRLGGPLKHLRMQTGTESGTVLLVTRADGDVLLVDPALLRLQKTFTGPKKVCPGPAKAAWPLVARRDGAVMLPSSVASALQVVHADGKVDEVEVAASNRVSARDLKPLTETRVQFAAVGGDADEVMATVDYWRDEERDWESETRLKFWQRGPDGQYRVTARVNEPHKAEVTSLSFDPTDPSRAITTSTDGALKMWTSTSSRPRPSSEPLWRCEAVVSYRNLPIRSSSWCGDGSLVAAVHEATVSVWDVAHVKRAALLAVPSLSKLSKAVWDGATDERVWLVGQHGMAVVDLSTGLPIAQSLLRPRWLVSTPGSSDLVFTERTASTDVVGVVSAQSLGTPRRVARLPFVAACVGTARRALAEPVGKYLPAGGSVEQLVFLTKEGSLVRLAGDGSRSTRRGMFASTAPREGMFSDLVAALPSPLAVRPPDSAAKGPAVKGGALSGAPHVVPPASMMWDELMASYTLPCKA